MTEPRPTLTFGDDDSDGSDTAWAWIAGHAWPGWRLAIVRAQDPVPGRPPRPEDEELRPWDPPRPRAVPAEAAFDEAVNLTCHGDPRVALLSSTDLLVIGPRGPGLLKSLRLGSTAEWLLQNPPSPLVVARAARPTNRVLVAADGSGHALAAVRAFARLPWAKQVDATVFHVADRRSGEGSGQAAADVLEAAGVTVTRRQGTGKPTGAILAAVQTESADLVVMGTQGLTGLRRLRLGSTAGAVARAAPCNVLLAGAEHAEHLDAASLSET